MTEQRRKLAAIAAVDLAGYSALTERDEAAAHQAVARLRAHAEAAAQTHGGRIFNTAGDSVMFAFGTASDALAAMEMLLKSAPNLRCGVHLGEVADAGGGDLLGHGVNVAARLQQIAEPGAIIVSGDVRRAARAAVGARLQARGARRLDKMEETIEIFEFAAVSGAAIEPPRHSTEPLIAVLPFDNLSNDPDMLFFSDGVSEEILQALARGAGFKVIGRVSSFQFRGQDKSPRRVSTELRATHILDGAVRRAGEKVRVTAHLIEAGNQTTVWADRFDRDLSDIFALQDEIAQQVATALEGAFRPRRRPPNVPGGCCDIFLRVRSKIVPNSRAELSETITALERVVAEAPGFAEAWGVLACARGLMSQVLRKDEEANETLRLAEDAADRAIAIDPHDAGAQAAFSLTAPTLQRQERHLRLAAAPGSHLPAFPLAYFLGDVGRAKEGLPWARRALELDPLNVQALLAHGELLVMMGRIDEGRAALAEAGEKFPESTQLAGQSIFMAAMAGDWADVDRRIDPARLARYPLHHLEKTLLPFVALVRNLTDEGRAILKAPLAASLERSRRAPYAQIAIVAQLCSPDEAYDAVAAKPHPFAFARSGVANHNDGGSFMFFLPFFNKVREDPRFPGLCAELGLAQYWAATQRWPDCADELDAAYDFRARCTELAAQPRPPGA